MRGLKTKTESNTFWSLKVGVVVVKTVNLSDSIYTFWVNSKVQNQAVMRLQNILEILLPYKTASRLIDKKD